MDPKVTTISLSGPAAVLPEAPAPGTVAVPARALAASANDADATARAAVRSVDALALAMRDSALGG